MHLYPITESTQPSLKDQPTLTVNLPSQDVHTRRYDAIQHIHTVNPINLNEITPPANNKLKRKRDCQSRSNFPGNINDKCSYPFRLIAIYPPQQPKYHTTDSKLVQASLIHALYLFGVCGDEEAEDEDNGQANQTDEVLGSLHCNFQNHNDHRSAQCQSVKRPWNK